MRIWSLHPSLLDRQGLLACWRETLLAQKVLLGQTKGYTNHPQLVRFTAQPDPIAAIGSYLQGIADEAGRRGYNFDTSKIEKTGALIQLDVTEGQVAYEAEHLKRKLAVRNPHLLHDFPEDPAIHPIFRLIPGPVADWEKTN